MAAGGYYAICYQKYKKAEEVTGSPIKSKAAKKYEAAAKFEDFGKSEPPISGLTSNYKDNAFVDLLDSPEPTRLAYE